MPEENYFRHSSVNAYSCTLEQQMWPPNCPLVVPNEYKAAYARISMADRREKENHTKEFRVYWTELRGTMLFFYDDKKAPKYSQKLDISALSSATSVHPDRNGSAQFILRLPDGEVELKASDCECGKEWKGFILTVTKLSVPSDESLLPGQITRMHEVLEKEKKRRITLSNFSSTSLKRSSSPSSPLTAMPACFHAVSRQEAAELLAKNPSCGSLILRPSSDSKSYAVTVRHDLGAPCLKHYRVLAKGRSYSIELERRVTVPSLQDVVNYFVSQTQGNLKPFVMKTGTAEDPAV